MGIDYTRASFSNVAYVNFSNNNLISTLFYHTNPVLHTNITSECSTRKVHCPFVFTTKNGAIGTIAPLSFLRNDCTDLLHRIFCSRIFRTFLNFFLITILRSCLYFFRNLQSCLIFFQNLRDGM
jgi:hypothetical protein